MSYSFIDIKKSGKAGHADVNKHSGDWLDGDYRSDWNFPFYA